MATTRAGHDFNPEEIKHVRNTSVGKPSLIIRTDFAGNIVSNGPIFAENFRAVMKGKRIAYEEKCNGVDIPAYDPGTEFGRLADCRPTSHEGIKNDRAPQTDRSIEGI